MANHETGGQVSRLCRQPRRDCILVASGSLLPGKSADRFSTTDEISDVVGCAWVLFTGLEARLYGRQGCPPLRACTTCSAMTK
jgi:hypothetical protein